MVGRVRRVKFGVSNGYGETFGMKGFGELECRGHVAMKR